MYHRSNHRQQKLEQMKTEFKVDKDGIEEKTWLKEVTNG